MIFIVNNKYLLYNVKLFIIEFIAILAIVIKMPFNTIIEVPVGTRIIALSDLHGDLDALLIAIRDCAIVIKCNLGK